MAFLHCETCDWKQDDFWRWGYNPARSLLRALRDYGWPRRTSFDGYVAKDWGWCVEDPGHPVPVHTWRVLWSEIRRFFRNLWRQKWWTNAAFMRKVHAKGRWPDCPCCGNRSLDID